MESGTGCKKHGRLRAPRNDAATPGAPRVVLKTAVLLYRSGNGSPARRCMNLHGQRKDGGALKRQQQAGQDAHTPQHTQTYKRKLQLDKAAHQTVWQAQGTAPHWRQLHKQAQRPLNRQKKQQLPQQHQGQYKHESKCSARLLMATLLLVVIHASPQMSSSSLAHGACLELLPALGALAVVSACVSLPRPTAKLARLSPARARAAAADQRRLAEDTVQVEEDRTAGRNGSEAPSVRRRAPATQQAAANDEEILPETGRKDAAARLQPSPESRLSIATKRKPAAARRSGTGASTRRDDRASAAADESVGEGGGERVRSSGATASRTNRQEGQQRAQLEADSITAEGSDSRQQPEERSRLQQSRASSAVEQKGVYAYVGEGRRPFEETKNVYPSQASERQVGLYVPESETPTPGDWSMLHAEGRKDSSVSVQTSDGAARLGGVFETPMNSSASVSESTSSRRGESGAEPRENVETSVSAGEALTPASTASAPFRETTGVSVRESVAAGRQTEAGTAVSGRVPPGDPLRAASTDAGGLRAVEEVGKGLSSRRPSLSEGMTPTADAATTPLSADAHAAEKGAADAGRPPPPDFAPADSCVVRQRLVEQRVAALEEQTRLADKLIQDAAEKQQRQFTAFEDRVQAVTEQLDTVQKGIDGLEKALASSGERLEKERNEQRAMFQRDLQTYIDSIGLGRAALQQAELLGKLNGLHSMHDTLSGKIRALAQGLEIMEEKRQARLEAATHKLQNIVEGRTSLAIAQLVTDAKHCAAGMQQLLNDAKLDQILLAQAAKEAEERLREQRFAAVDISHVDESMSFRGITSAFNALLQGTFPRKELVLIYFVTVRPPRLADAAYANVFLVPSADTTRRLLSAVVADPSLSEMVVKVESVMAEAWKLTPHRAHLQYIVPTPQEGLRMAGHVDYVYEFMKTMHKVTQEEAASGQMTESRPGILVYTGMRRGVEAPEDTPYTESRKLQILRYLVTMYTSPVQETARLWQIMKNEVQLLDIFAPLQPVEVDGCHLRVYGGPAPLPEIPHSPFIKGSIMFVRVELTRSGTRYSLFPGPGLWSRILQHLALSDRTGIGTFAVLKARLGSVSWIRSRMMRLFQSPPRGELVVHVHNYQRTTQPPELQGAKAEGSQGRTEQDLFASHEYHKGFAGAVDSITETLAHSVLPYTARKGFTMRRHLFVHVCETNLSCGSLESD